MARKTVVKIFALAATATTAVIFFGASAAFAGDTGQPATTPAPATVVVTPSPSPTLNNPWD
ncbi:hypothetical protein ACTOB_003901 [Actinoplanes oblitus]|uniref:Uncharacterized protein n=1 Tax=Actinoplanes oblitus TaxID=3040509 RepID=A0ABY8WQP4_9ACTN|nr:hypothetical protein [Actinoplanes oblitus]WIN00207.1 hypothetical protein ACTOB_003901 [Actinoplanes oblitus]